MPSAHTSHVQTTKMIRQEEVYRIGQMGKPHGVKGEMQMRITDDVFDRVDAEYIVLDVDGILVPFFIDGYAFRSDTLVVIQLSGVDTEEKARELTGCGVYFPRALSDAEEGNVSLAEIIGYTIYNKVREETVGTVTDVDDSTMNILLHVDTGKGRVLIPVAEDWIKHIDAEKHVVEMELPDGLTELND